MNRNILTQAGLVAGGICVGGAVGYFAARKRLIPVYEKILETEVAEAKEFYSLLRGEPPYDNPVVAAKKYRERIEQLDFWVANGIPEEDLEEFNNSVDLEDEGEVFINEQPNPEPQPEPELEAPVIYDQLVGEKHLEHVNQTLQDAAENIRLTVEAPTQAQQILTLEDVTSQPTDISNVFTEAEVKRYDLEAAKDLPQTSKFTHVISVDEYMEEDHEMTKISLMYYAEDQVLADDDDRIVPAAEIDAIIGTESLKHFGKGSDDENVVYVKNTDRNLLIEVTQDPRSYPVAVFKIANSVMNKKVPRSEDG